MTNDMSHAAPVRPQRRAAPRAGQRQAAALAFGIKRESLFPAAPQKQRHRFAFGFIIHLPERRRGIALEPFGSPSRQERQVARFFGRRQERSVKRAPPLVFSGAEVPGFFRLSGPVRICLSGFMTVSGSCVAPGLFCAARFAGGIFADMARVKTADLPSRTVKIDRHRGGSRVQMHPGEHDFGNQPAFSGGLRRQHR